jgi:hypothetical protein
MARQTTESSFDELTRGLASGTLSRGRALRLMGAALVGGTLGSLGISKAAAEDDRCSEGQTRCGERCVNLKTNERHCGSCRNRCGSNQTCCKGRCVNLQRNERHCGSCFNRCAEGQECVNGECTFRTCTEFGTDCGQSFDPALQCVCRPEDNFDSGPFFCAEPVVLACSRPCTTTSECPPSTRCEAPLVVGEQGVCVAECGTDPDLACR